MSAPLAVGIFLRSLLVQASWSFAGMQSLGYLLMTAAADRALPPQQRAAVGLRRLRGFNTHPYLAGMVAATVIREERSGAAESGVETLKTSLMCALGSIGDEFFWGALRPLAAVAALPAALAGAWWAPLVLLALFNGPHLGVRALGVGLGLTRGRNDVVAVLQRRPLQRALPALSLATVALAGVVVGRNAFDPLWTLLPAAGAVSAVASLAVFAAFFALVARGGGQSRLLAGTTAATLLAAVLRLAVS